MWWAARLTVDAGQTSGHGIRAADSGQLTTAAKFLDQAPGQPRESAIGIRRGGPGKCDPGILRLSPQLSVEIPHHFDVIGDKSNGTDDHGFDAAGAQHLEMVSDIGLEPRNLGRS